MRGGEFYGIKGSLKGEREVLRKEGSEGGGEVFVRRGKE